MKEKFSPLVSPAKFQVLKSRVLLVAVVVVSAGGGHFQGSGRFCGQRGLGGQAWTPEGAEWVWMDHRSVAVEEGLAESMTPAPPLLAWKVTTAPPWSLILHQPSDASVALGPAGLLSGRCRMLPCRGLRAL